MTEVVHLTAEDVRNVIGWLETAQASARLCIQDGGIKVSPDHQVWTLPIGEVRVP